MQNIYILNDFASQNIFFQPGNGKKPKRGPFKRFGSLTFARNTENGKFNHGFKLGKCFILKDKTVSKITGTFVNDSLQVFNCLSRLLQSEQQFVLTFQGHVRIQFVDETYRIGHISDGFLSGIHRHFNADNILVNITDFDTGTKIYIESH